MKSFVALALAATALAQCSDSTQGDFTISTVNVTSSPSKRDLEARQLAGVLRITLQGGNMKDQANRIGYIASNYQFQFDNPVQAGARTQTGFGICGNNSLTHGGSAVWYQCDSGNLYNLYSQSQGGQCFPIYIIANKSGGSGSGVTQISDGQPQAPTPVTQITDGQPQAPKPTNSPVTQISDGQPQAPKPTNKPVTQISDGQPQAPKPTAVVTQISDGQPQAPKPTAKPVTQISDGQPQAPKPTAVVTQISDGQPQAPKPTGNATRPQPSQFTGAAATGNAATGAFVAGLFGLFAML